jgi:hypothetical protein
MRIFREGVRKKQNKPKKVYTKEEINERDKYGLRARDYLFVIIAGITTYVICWAYRIDLTKNLLITALVMIIVLLILTKITAAPQPRKEIYAWLIVWIDNSGFYHKNPSHHALRLVYGKAKEMEDGTYKSIPDTFQMTYYLMGEGQKRFNPLLNVDNMVLKQMRKNNETILWCDGTDRYRNAIEAMNNRRGLKESKGLTKKNVQNTTNWFANRGKVEG